MLEQAVITSLKILFVYAAMREGMILHPLRRVLDRIMEPLPVKVMLWLRKPLYDCLFCMSSVWGLFFTWDAAVFYRVGWDYLLFLFTVAGINYIVQSAFINTGGE